MDTNALADDAVVPFATSPRAGRSKGATMTVENPDNGVRFTYRFRRPKDKDGTPFKSILVDLMVGADNESDYKYLGTLSKFQNTGDTTRMKLSARNKVGGERAQVAAVALDWTLVKAQRGELSRTGVRALHSGKCGRCGRKLTVPESIDRGLGPECAGLHTH